MTKRQMIIILVAGAMVLVGGIMIGRATVQTDDADRSEEPAETPPPTEPAPPPSTSDAPAPPSTAAVAEGDDFVEDFTDNTGLDRFQYGLWHRDDNVGEDGVWSGDHDLDCGTPDTQRTIRRPDWSDAFYLCRDHLMTSVGTASSYSIAWFSPNQTFDSDQTSVSWDVNLTDLLGRQWWEVMIYPISDAGTYHRPQESTDGTDCPVCATEEWIASGTVEYQNGAVVLGNGPFGGRINVWHNGDQALNSQDRAISYCDAPWEPFHEDPACTTPKTRLTFSLVDNENGTITADFGGQWSETFDGSFPDEPWRVVFKDHSYTPQKDGEPTGFTWHWDNIAIT